MLTFPVMRNFKIPLEDRDRAEFAQVLGQEREREKKWWECESARATGAAVTKVASAEALRKVRADRARRRASGELLGTRDALIAHCLRFVMEQRGLTAREYAPVPEGERHSGRPLGDFRQKHGHAAKGGVRYETALSVHLPDELGEQLARSVYWETIGPVNALRAWQQEWEGKTVTQEILAQRDALRALIFSAGEVLRQAVREAAAIYRVRHDQEDCDENEETGS